MNTDEDMDKDTDKDTNKDTDKDTHMHTDMHTDTDTDMELEYLCYIFIWRYSPYSSGWITCCIAGNRSWLHVIFPRHKIIGSPV
jgi:hypothetical protein